MTIKKTVLILIAAMLIIVAAFFAKRKFYDARYRFEIATKEVKDFADKGELRDGDLIFQTSLSAQSKAIQLATHSEYSHCGIIFKQQENYIVLEAVEPVKQTPLDKWIARGKGGHFVIRRLKNAGQVLTPSALQNMKQISEGFVGKSYDLYFSWSDDKIYCSELIWKIYQRATGLEIGKLQKLGDFDLSDERVKQKLAERYGDNIPLNDTVISPVSIFNSELLTTVKSN